MKCPSCGRDVPEGKKFCTNCGAPMGERTVQMPTVPGPPQPSPPPPGSTLQMTAVAPGPPAGSGRSKTTWIIVAVVVGILVIGGIVGGIIAWRVSAGNKPVADIEKVELTRSDGKDIDLEKVPLDVELTLEATFRAKYKEDGKATLSIYVEDSEGEEVISDSYKVKSSGEPQKKILEFHMTVSLGKPLEAKAVLKVTQGEKDLSDSATLEYTAVEGKGKEATLEEVKDKATGKLEEASNAVKEIIGMGIEASDLVKLLDDAIDNLKDAETVEEADGSYEVAVNVINECGSRKAAYQDEKNKNQAISTCRGNQTQIRERLRGYYDEGGNFPNSMSDLGHLPACPSGGSYTYQADLSIDPPGLSVSCSVHGTLLPGI